MVDHEYLLGKFLFYHNWYLLCQYLWIYFLKIDHFFILFVLDIHRLIIEIS